MLREYFTAIVMLLGALVPNS